MIEIRKLYVELVASAAWPVEHFQRRTPQGQALMCALRNYVAMAEGTTAEEVQNAVAGEAAALMSRFASPGYDEAETLEEFYALAKADRAAKAKPAPDRWVSLGEAFAAAAKA